MSERKINLEEILYSIQLENGAKFNSFISKEGNIYEIVMVAMKKACEKTLELAAENAAVIPCNCPIEGITSIDLFLKDGRYVICDKDSIINTISQIE